MAEELKEKVINLEDLKQAYDLLKEIFESDVGLKVNAGNIPGCTMWFGTKEEYEAMPEHDPNTFYNVDDGATQSAIMKIRGTRLQADLPTENQAEGDTYLLSDTTGPFVGQMAIWIIEEGIGNWGYTSASVQVDETVTPTGTNPVNGKAVYEHCLAKTSTIKKIVTITLAEYEALSVKESTTLYNIVDDCVPMAATEFQQFYDGIFPVNSIQFGFTAPGVPSGIVATWTDVSTEYINKYFKVSSDAAGTLKPESITVAGTALTVAQLPSHNHTFTGSSVTTSSAGKHSHTKGSMNITGSVGDFFCQNNVTTSGAFTHTRTLTFNYSGGANGIYFEKVGLNAANDGAWTGSTSEEGAHTHSVTAAGSISSTGSGQAHTHSVSAINPASVAIKVWKRTA